MINLSESLVRVPGIVALNRWNYAQDLQISSRGFGARATFGVRGLRLYQDEIPATMPDGQGQTGSFQLFSTDHIEVLRGPFSTLYGNAAGGVITVFTESGTPSPELTVNFGAGSFGSWTTGAKLTGTSNGVGYVAAGTTFQTDGFREHSAAERNLAAAKLSFAPGSRTSVTILGTLQDQPESQDPLGLTRAQWEADPQQADPVALLFDTRKTVHQQQGGLRVDHSFSDDTTLRLTGYGGTRQVRQYLALSGIAPTSSGGVTDLDRDYGGASLKLFQRFIVAERPAYAGGRRRLGHAARTAARLRQQQRKPRRAAPQRGRHGQRQRLLRAAELGLRAALERDCRRPFEQRAVRVAGRVHYGGQSGRQRKPHLSPDDAGSGRDVPRDRNAQSLRQLWPGIRDADVRRARLPAVGSRTQLRPAARHKRVDRGWIEGDRRAASSGDCGAVRHRHRRRDRRQHGHGRTHDLPQRRQDAPPWRRAHVRRRSWRKG